MRCPRCGKKIEHPDPTCRPFCSDRCKLLDLGKWISEEYRIAAVETVEDKSDPIFKPDNPEEK